MKLVDLLSPAAITLDLASSSKKEALQELCQLLVTSGKLSDAAPLVKSLLDREALGSTGIGQGVAIPHGKLPMVKDQIAALGVSKKGVEFDALDGDPVHIIFLLVAPQDAAGNHLKALAKVSRLLKDKFFRQALREARTPAEVLKKIQEEDDY